MAFTKENRSLCKATRRVRRCSRRGFVVPTRRVFFLFCTIAELFSLERKMHHAAAEVEGTVIREKGRPWRTLVSY